MSAGQEQHAPGGHYSGRNRIPNIQEFVASLDRDKKTRDAQIDASANPNASNNGVPDHKPEPIRKQGRIVTDPVTGNNVEIADVDADFMKAANENTVSSIFSLEFGVRKEFQLSQTLDLCAQRQPGQGN